MTKTVWKKVKVIDIAKSMADAPFGSNLKNTDYREEGVLIIQGKNIQGRTCDWNDKRFVTKEKFDSLKRHQAKAGELLFPKVGTIGKVGILTPYDMRKEYLLSTNTMKLEVDESLADKNYIYYFFSSKEVSDHIIKISPNSVQPVFNFTALKNYEIPLPPLPIQRKISTILASLDEKIELNRQIAQTLEAIAQAIFKEWFIDFNFPGATGEMQESELGEIPKGWRIGKLVNVCRNIRRGVHPKNLKNETPYLGLEHIQRKTLSIPAWGSSADVDSQKFGFKKGDILFGKLRPYFHKVGIAPVDGICSTDILVIEPLEKEFYLFAVNHLFDEKLITHVSAIADGTRMPRVDWKSIMNYQIVIPDALIIEKFNEATREFYNQILFSIEENKTITQLRDNLLPKLMKGELSLKDQTA
jgi:type I restriction enzyme S subunit